MSGGTQTSSKDAWDKLEIVGGIVSSLISGLLLLLVAIVINKRGKEVAEARENGELVAGLIESLADSTNMRKDLAILALNHAVPPSNNGRDVVIQICERLLREEPIGPSQGRLTLDIVRERRKTRADSIEAEIDAAYTKQQQAAVARAQLANIRNDSAAAPMKAEIERLERQAAAAPAQSQVASNLANHVVYLQFRRRGEGRVDRTRMEGLRTELQRASFNAPGVEGISRDFRSGVRFFRPEDQTLADSVADVTRRILQMPELPVERATYDEPSRQIEVWIDLGRRPVANVPSDNLASPP